MSDTSERIAIVTDSTADIPEGEARAGNITIVPALLTIENQTYRDGIDLSRDEFYRRLPSASTPPTTAVPSPLTFEETYQQLLSSGHNRILSIHLSAKLSGMINVVNQAAQNFGDRIRIYDSQQVSLGLGFQAMEAAAGAAEGHTIDAIIQTLNEIREKIRLIAMLDTQEYLYRSGRVNWATANLGKMLRIRLLVEVSRGEVIRKALVRTRSKAVEELIALGRSWGSLRRLAVLHTAVGDEAASLADQLGELTTTQPLVVEATTLLGVHVGPAALGIAGLCI